jgi:hypothetical protein
LSVGVSLSDEFGEGFVGGFEAQDFAGSVVEAFGDGVEVVLGTQHHPSASANNLWLCDFMRNMLVRAEAQGTRRSLGVIATVTVILGSRKIVHETAIDNLLPFYGQRLRRC